MKKINLDQRLRDIEIRIITKYYNFTGSVAKAARLLGIKRTTLSMRLKRMAAQGVGPKVKSHKVNKGIENDQETKV